MKKKKRETSNILSLWAFAIIVFLLLFSIFFVSLSEGAVTASRMGYSAADGTVYPKYYRPLRVDSLVMKVDGSMDTLTGFGNGLTVVNDVIEADTGVVATKNYVDDNVTASWNWDDSASNGASGPFWVDSALYAVEADSTLGGAARSTWADHADSAGIAAAVSFDTTHFRYAYDSVLAWDNGSLISGLLTSATAASTYETITNVGKIGDDTASFKAAVDSVAAWDNRAYPDATTALKGIASFSSTYFSVSSGAVSIASGGVTSASISNQTITKADIDTTSSNFPFDAAYKVTTAVADSAYATIRYARKVAGDSAAAYAPTTGSITTNEILNGTILSEDLSDDIALTSVANVTIQNDAMVYGNLHELNKVKRIPKRGTIYTEPPANALYFKEFFTNYPNDSCVVHPSWIYDNMNKFGAIAGDTFRFHGHADSLDTVAVTVQWPYFACYTPLHGGDSTENPCIAVSNDKIKWRPPFYICTDGSAHGNKNGIIDDTVWSRNPLMRASQHQLAAGTPLYCSDAFATKTQEGYTAVYWRLNTSGAGNIIYNMTSPNGVFWRPDSSGTYPNVHDTETVTNTVSLGATFLLSPSVLLNNGTYEMYYCDPVGGYSENPAETTYVIRATATSYAGPFTNPDTCHVNYRSGYWPWHAQVNNYYGQLVMITTDIVDGAEASGAYHTLNLYCADSSVWKSEQDWASVLRFPTYSDTVTVINGAEGTVDSVKLILHPALELGANDTIGIAALTCKRAITQAATWVKYDGSNNWGTQGGRNSTSDIYAMSNYAYIKSLNSGNTGATARCTLRLDANFSATYENILLAYTCYNAQDCDDSRPTGTMPVVATFFSANDTTSGKDGPKLLLYCKDALSQPFTRTISGTSDTAICKDGMLNKAYPTVAYAHDTVLRVGRTNEGSWVPVFDYYGEIMAPDSLNSGSFYNYTIYKSSPLFIEGADGNVYIDLLGSCKSSGDYWYIFNTQVHFLTERSYIDLDQVYGRFGGTDSFVVWPNVFEGATKYLSIDSCITAAVDTVWYIGATGDMCVVDTMEIVYKMTSGSKIINKYLYGPDYSDGYKLSDSLYVTDTVDLASTSIAQHKFGTNNLKRKYGVFYPAGGQIGLKLEKNLEANDKAWIRTNRAWIWRKP